MSGAGAALAGSLPAGQPGHVGVAQGVVVDADVVDIAAADELIGALHLVRRDHPAVRAELVEAGVQRGRLGLRGDRLAVDIERDALGLVPAEGDQDPLVGLGRGLVVLTRTRARLSSVTKASKPLPFQSMRSQVMSQLVWSA
jgi:hypothetical protein